MVQLTIYNAEDLTLVRETRRITFRRGMNPLQFSWANTLIDPTSVDLRFASHARELDVLDTTRSWNDHEQWVERIRNYRDKPIQVQIRRSYGGHVIFASDLAPTLYDYRSPQFTARIAAAQERDLSYEVTFKQGINKKQDNVTLQ